MNSDYVKYKLKQFIKENTFTNDTGEKEISFEIHQSLDDLLYEVLRAIAEGNAEDPVEMAKVCISFEELNFPRYYS